MMNNTGKAREIPFQSDEIATPHDKSNVSDCPSESNKSETKLNHTSSDNNNKNKKTTVASLPTSDDNEEQEESSEKQQQQLALAPLHPSSKKSDAKLLPIVLGRTNLAAWWWKSCPCQHYCRLHCRPVAQNIRSLSKVMISIDTAGRVHIVGKNPHLITITPEREDNILRENDIISVGRRDREPWMRFQAIRKPVNTRAGGMAGASSTRSKANTRRPLANTTKPTAQGTTAVNPPEWITTNTRKRKSMRSNTKTSKVQSKASKENQPDRPQGPVINDQDRVQATAQEAASAATIARVQRSYAKANHQSASRDFLSEPARKRRRRTTETSGNDTTPKKLSRRSLRNGGRGKNGEGEAFDKTSGGNTTTTNGENKRDHPHVHLVFQDYQTSASLLVSNESRRKSESSINQATSKASSAESVVRQHQYGRVAPPRAFVADKSQLPLLSKNFAEALMESVSPPTNHDEIMDKIATEPTSTKNEIKDVKADSTVAAKKKQKLLLLPSSDELEQLPQSNENQGLLNTLLQSQKMESNEADAIAGDDSSMLSVPECPSSSFEAGQKDVIVEPSSTLEQSTVAGLIFAAATKSSEEASPVQEDESSSLSPPVRDPMTDLKPWQDMIEHEEDNGNHNSFRHALASLIVAKNQEAKQQQHTEDSQDEGLTWLPPLLSEDFHVQKRQE